MPLSLDGWELCLDTGPDIFMWSFFGRIIETDCFEAFQEWHDSHHETLKDIWCGGIWGKSLVPDLKALGGGGSRRVGEKTHTAGFVNVQHDIESLCVLPQRKS